MVFDSDEYEGFNELTEEEKIDFSINYVLGKVKHKSQKVAFFLEEAKRKSDEENKNYKGKKIDSLTALKWKNEISQKMKLEKFLERETERKRQIRENARKRWKEFEGKNARKDFQFKIFIQWPHTRQENKKRNIRRNR